MTKTFAVIGDPIDHSLSPNIHNAAFRELDLDCTYIAYKIPKNELSYGLDALKKIKISGFNVTIPHKIDIMKFLDHVDEDSKLIGASNTVTNQNGVLTGYNTDMQGFLDPIIQRELGIKNSNILLYGAGGAARAIIVAFAKQNAKKITIVNRTIEKGKNLEELGKKLGLNSEVISLENFEGNKNKYDFVINSTSIGMKNEIFPISQDLIDENSVVYDIVYKPINTDLIKKGKNVNATIIYGYEMLLGQAVRSFEIWMDKKAPYSSMKKAILGGFS
ncbi:MAG: shikimate dehydrogenase [Thermoproteota archaeon]|nr:shikimate dehydrogenase [Thermoproteota archaeon]